MFSYVKKNNQNNKKKKPTEKLAKIWVEAPSAFPFCFEFALPT